MEGALAAYLDAADGLAELIKYGCQAGAGAGLQFVPFPVRVEEQERRFDDQFGANVVAVVGVGRGEAEPDLVVEGCPVDTAAGQKGRKLSSGVS